MKSILVSLLTAGFTGFSIALFGTAIGVPYWMILILCGVSGYVLAYIHVHERLKDDQ